MNSLKLNQNKHLLKLLISILFLIVGCGQSPEKNYYIKNNHISKKTVDVPLSEQLNSTEAHGGEVHPSIILKAYSYLTSTPEDLKKESLGLMSSENKSTFKETLHQLWQGVRLALLNERITSPRGTQIKEHLKLMVQGKKIKNTDKFFNVFDDIKKSPLKVVIDPLSLPHVLDSKKQVLPEYKNTYHYGQCFSHYGENEKKVVDASSQLDDLGGEICLSASGIAKSSKKEEGPRYFAIDAHERAHHFGLHEKEALDIQNYIDENANEFISLYNYYSILKKSPQYNHFLSKDILDINPGAYLDIAVSCHSSKPFEISQVTSSNFIVSGYQHTSPPIWQHSHMRFKFYSSEWDISEQESFLEDELELALNLGDTSMTDMKKIISIKFHIPQRFIKAPALKSLNIFDIIPLSPHVFCDLYEVALKNKEGRTIDGASIQIENPRDKRWKHLLYNKDALSIFFM